MASSAPKSTPSHGLAAYRRVLGAPHVLPLALSSIVARLPGGMAPVALILYVHGNSGSFAAAGIVAGAFTIGLGLTGPLLARLIDRYGSEPVILPGNLVATLALAAIVPLGHAGAGAGLLAVVAALGGAGMPPVGGVMRQRLPRLVSAHDLPTVYALDSVGIEAVFVIGPLLAGLLAATVGAGPAVLAAAAIGGLGTAWFDLLTRAAPSNREERRRAGWAGALAAPAMRTLVLTGIPLGATFGALDVALPAFGGEHGNTALGGPFMTSLALGSAIGALVYGARPQLLGAPSRALFVLGGVQAATCLPILLVANVPEMFAATWLAGICVAPLITVRNQLAKAGVLVGTGTEAFTWLGLSMTVGSSVGSAVAGPIVQAGGWQAGALLACAMPILSVLVGLANREALVGDRAEAAVA